MSQRKPALSLAATVAALALSPLALAADNPPGSVGKAISASDKVHCYGLHFCSPFHECAGKQSCKTPSKCRAQGFLKMSAKECLDRDGTIGDVEVSREASPQPR
jgi:uncharacterized membrane protein